MRMFLLLLASPFLAVFMAIVVVLFVAGELFLRLLLWPYKLLAGLVSLILGGGVR